MDGLEEGYALGLDLGTTYSCIGVYRNGGVEIIPNRNGDKTTPSIVTIINKDEILRGEEALGNLVKDYDSSIYAIKRFIGRKYNDSQLKNEITKENFPFKIVADKKGIFPLVLIDKNKQKIEFTLEEISSFVIRKMVDNAEAYLGKKVSKLVITVPANFNDAQRNCTKQAAQLAGIEVLRIINEPTAAALAYGLETSKDSPGDAEKKILVFDLGGGTFDVTILKISKEGEQNFDILSTKGDKFLGGEDFDNRLADYVLDKFCNKMKIPKEEIHKDRKSMKRLKISCENIKRVLSSSDETTLYIKDFYKNNDILEVVTRNEFEKQCSELFDKLKKPIEDALLDAKLSKEQIKEIVLVGGSSRMPKVKTFLQEFFNIKVNKKGPSTTGTIINDSINPDETVAYGATLMAAKILIKKDNNLAGFNLMDITPLSLGINVKNTSEDPEIQKEGNMMSVLIKRGLKIPLTNVKTYQTSYDNQTDVDILIFEGEKKYTKYNHVLGKVELRNIPKKKKGEVKIDVKFFIDVNGILTVTAVEQLTGKTIETKIKNDTVGLTDEDIEKIKQKNKQLMENVHKNETGRTDYANLKETLKDFQDAYNEAEDEEDKYNILLNYNCALEEFIDLLDKNFDNETMVEKYYIYVKQLLLSYTKLLELKSQVTKGDTENITQKMKEYIKVFTEHNSGYLDDLIEVMKPINKKIFYEIVINSIEQLNECGKNCLKERKPFCKYHSLIYFEKADAYFKKYIVDFKNLAVAGKVLLEKCKSQRAVSLTYIADINSGAVLLYELSLKSNKLIQSNMTGFTSTLLGLKLSPQEEAEKYQIILSNYEKMLIGLSDQKSKEKAICIANILKLSIRFLGDMNYTKYFKLAKDCSFLVDSLHLDKNEEWYKDFEEINKEIEENYQIINENLKEMRKNIKEKYKNEFDKVDKKFLEKKNNLEFINFVLDFKPYKEYEEDKKNKKIDFTKANQELLKYLTSKYHPDKYKYSQDDEESQLNFCLIESIDSYLNRMYNELQ